MHLCPSQIWDSFNGTTYLTWFFLRPYTRELSKLEFDFNNKESIDGFKMYKENINAASGAVVDFRRLKTH